MPYSKLILTTVLAAGLCACGAKDETSLSTQSSAAPEIVQEVQQAEHQHAYTKPAQDGYYATVKPGASVTLILCQVTACVSLGPVLQRHLIWRPKDRIFGMLM